MARSTVGGFSLPTDGNIDIGGSNDIGAIVSAVNSVTAGTFHPSATIADGGSTSQRIAIGGTSACGIYWGNTVPSIAANKGSIYLRVDGSTVNDRMYVNTNGSTGWTAVTTAA